MLDADKSDFETLESVREKLNAIEDRLALQYCLTGDVRAKLIVLDRNNQLPEDETVAEWHELLSSYLDFIKTSQGR